MHRLHWIDNLRILVIILVVILHAAVTYSGMGGWYYKENESVDTVSTIFFAFYLTFNQAYFMSLLFMVSGYFSQKSLERKGVRKFLSGRFKRLGIPLLIYIFMLHPLSVKLAYPEVDILNWTLEGIKDFRFIGWTGPLWFVEALLLFNVFYLLLFRPLPQSFSRININFKLLPVLGLVLVISLIAFTVRLAYPIGSDVANLQFSFFTAYIFLFSAGILAYKNGAFEKITYRDGKRWLAISLGVGIPFWALLIYFGGPMDGIMLIEGGWNWPALFYAIWESFFCVTFIVALVGIFKYKMNITSRVQKFLSDNAFGVFVFHAPILIGISMLFRELDGHPLLKFLFVSVLAVSASFGIAWLIRRVPVFRRVFS